MTVQTAEHEVLARASGCGDPLAHDHHFAEASITRMRGAGAYRVRVSQVWTHDDRETSREVAAQAFAGDLTEALHEANTQLMQAGDTLGLAALGDAAAQWEDTSGAAGAR